MRWSLVIVVASGLGLVSGRAASEEAESAAETEAPSETDLMLEALRAVRGESPNSAKIERITAEVRSESRRRRLEEKQALQVWKDPFAEDPERPIPVRAVSRKGREGERGESGRVSGREPASGQRDLVRQLARARAETAVAQAAAASARAEAARAKATAARAEAAAAHAEAVAARREAEAARNACSAPADERRHSVQARRSDSRGASRAPAKDRLDSFSLARAPRSKSRRMVASGASSGSRPAAPPPRAGEPTERAPAPVPSAAFTSTSGILVVPITR